MTIYALDDNGVQLLYYQRVFNAECFTHYRALMKRMHDQKPDLFICDLIMPEIDGWRVIEKVRKLYPDLPVLVATASGDPIHRAMAEVSGCAYWNKGAYPELRRLVKQWTYKG